MFRGSARCPASLGARYCLYAVDRSAATVGTGGRGRSGRAKGRGNGKIRRYRTTGLAPAARGELRSKMPTALRTAVRPPSERAATAQRRLKNGFQQSLGSRCAVGSTALERRTRPYPPTAPPTVAPTAPPTAGADCGCRLRGDSGTTAARRRGDLGGRPWARPHPRPHPRPWPRLHPRLRVLTAGRQRGDGGTTAARRRGDLGGRPWWAKRQSAVVASRFRTHFLSHGTCFSRCMVLMICGTGRMVSGWLRGRGVQQRRAGTWGGGRSVRRGATARRRRRGGRDTATATYVDHAVRDHLRRHEARPVNELAFRVSPASRRLVRLGSVLGGFGPCFVVAASVAGTQAAPVHLWGHASDCVPTARRQRRDGGRQRTDCGP